MWRVEREGVAAPFSQWRMFTSISPSERRKEKGKKGLPPKPTLRKGGGRSKQEKGLGENHSSESNFYKSVRSPTSRFH